MSDYRRWQTQNLKEALETRRVIMIVGARQCGKTTLVRTLALPNSVYRTLDDATAKQAAEQDYDLFIQAASAGTTLIIDEIQKVPELLSTIKKVVDQDNRPGQFLITGSANILTLPTVQESLAGRVGKIRLRPLSQGEILGGTPNFLKQAFAGKFLIPKQRFNRQALIEMIFRGGFPEAVRLKPKSRKAWHMDYIDALIEHDLPNHGSIRQSDVIKDLLGILAAWSTKPMDITAIGSHLSIDRRTLSNYISALETFYLVEKIFPWLKTDYERVSKLKKLVMTDTGMMAALLGWKVADVHDDADKAGKMFETFAYNELMVQIDAAEDVYTLYHYRDREKREIDFLIEREDKALLAIEVKSGLTVKKSDFQHIEWFKNNVVGDRQMMGIVLYAGEEALSFGKNLWAVPFDYLWG